LSSVRAETWTNKLSRELSRCVQIRTLGKIEEEFQGSDIPDWRLRERLLSLAKLLGDSPDASLPRAVKTSAAREAAYRFLGNHKVTLEGILAPHVRATVRRCSRDRTVYVVSDTTECSFSGVERGKSLGRLQGNSRGFLAHFALAVSESGEPLGLLGADILVRDSGKKQHRNTHQRKKDPNRESLRWATMVESTSRALEGTAAIHVMDSEADIYELLTDLRREGRRFIIRSGQRRLVEEGHLADVVERATVLLSREVRLSRRSNDGRSTGKTSSKRNPPRQGRLAQLTVSSLRVSLKKPKTCGTEYPAWLPVNIVRVFEASPPDGETPVEWILLTSERVDSPSDVGDVIDGYRRRWLIEEYFKAIKTGCSYETRELESLRTLTNLLGIVAVIAWRLLLLRTLHRQDSQRPATDVIDRDLLEALAARLKDIGEPRSLPPEPTVVDLMSAIARLGGHITSNGAPGWQVLWRGYQDLLTWGGGFIRGKSITYGDQS
jgi:Transposase DNA-binding/Transposase DDE domain